MYPGLFAALTPDKPAVIMADTGEIVTYAQLEDRSIRLAHALRDRGLVRGDCVAILAENHPRYFDTYWAAMRSGLYVTALNTHLGLDEALYILRDAGVKALVVSAGKAELAVAIAAAMPELVVRLAFASGSARAVEGYDDLDTVLATASPVPDADQPAGQDMLYSSGTTGRPKGIRPPMPDRQVTDPGNTMIAVFGTRFGFDADTVYLSPAPLYHAAPLRYCVMTTATGGTAVIMGKFHAERALALIEQYGVTHSQWVPTMFVRMLKLPEAVRTSYDVGSLKVAVHAAAPCPVDVKQQMIEWWGPVLEEYYAATEVHGITLITSAEWLTHPGSVGRGGRGIVRVCDDSLEDQPELAVGEVGL
ncbi:MAG: AMP-binding protein, partial [Cellulomonas sp.]|nr:AMP-binding protein [Cellulomonas sp.]